MPMPMGPRGLCLACSMALTEPLTLILMLTDADRAAAVAPAGGHAAHDNTIQSFTLIDRLEIWNTDQGSGLEWKARPGSAPILNRLWLQEGERIGGRTETRAWKRCTGAACPPQGRCRSAPRLLPARRLAGFRCHWGNGLGAHKFEVAATAYLGSFARPRLGSRPSTKHR